MCRIVSGLRGTRICNWVRAPLCADDRPSRPPESALASVGQPFRFAPESRALKIGMSLARRNWTFDEAVNPRGTFLRRNSVCGRSYTDSRSSVCRFSARARDKRAGQRRAVCDSDEQLVAQLLRPG